jgi:hypothetical protein
MPPPCAAAAALSHKWALYGASGAGGGPLTHARALRRYRRVALGQAATAACHVRSLFAAAAATERRRWQATEICARSSPRCSGMPRTHERTLIAALPLPPVNEE